MVEPLASAGKLSGRPSVVSKGVIDRHGRSSLLTMPQKWVVPKKSPSVPNFYDQSYTNKNASAPNLVKQQLQPSILVKVASAEEADTGLSFIDLYGDENEHDEQEGTNRSADPPDVPSPSSEHFDRYGFKKQSAYVSEEEYDAWWAEYSLYCIRRKQKWQLFMEKSGLPLDDGCPRRFPSRSEKLKRYVRKGIPAEWRGNAWWHFARGQEKLNKNKGLYDDLLKKMDDYMNTKQKDKLIDLDVIERDLNRTFPDNIHFQRQNFQNGEPPLITSLRHVLVAFSIYNPKIGYCQSMNFLAALLLLFMDEEKAFWMLVIITSRYLPGVHNINLEGVNIDQGVLMLCLREYVPDFWSYIEPSIITDHMHKNIFGHYDSPTHSKHMGNSLIKNEFLYKLPPITLSTASWFMSCFIGILPIETTLRIWDCMFYEESHFLFKASLAILKLCEAELSKNKPHRVLSHYSLSNNSTSGTNGGDTSSKSYNQDETDMEVFQIIQAFPKRLIDPNEIFEKVIFKKRLALNKLNQDEVDRCRKYVASQRLKYKHYCEVLNQSSKDEGSKDSTTAKEVPGSNKIITNEMVNDALSSEVYGFKKSLNGVHWNNSIKERVRQMRNKKK